MFNKQKNKSSVTIAGEVRPSQLIWTYGPGSVIDLQNVSVMTLGLQDWESLYWNPVRIYEPRLLVQVQRLLPYVKELRVPPVANESIYKEGGFKNHAGVPVSLFPRWYRCRICGLLSSIDSGSVFEVKGSSPFKLKVVHKNCPKCGNKPAPAVPARFLIACKNGHISDFPWREYVHGGPTQCTGTLNFSEKGSSLQTENLLVTCEGCNKTKNMAMAFGKSAKQNLPKCPGTSPHYGPTAKATTCGEDVKTLMLGASNSWFPKVLTVLSLPKEFTAKENPLQEQIQNALDDLKDLGAATREELEATLAKNIFRKSYPDLINYSTDEIWEELERCRSAKKDSDNSDVSEDSEAPDESEDILLPEWRSLTSSKIPFKEDEFEAVNGVVPAEFEPYFSRIVLVNRLKEVRVLIGFTRLEAEDPMLSEANQPHWSRLSNDKTPWLPAMEMRGEGIFIQFNEEALNQWEARAEVKEREAKLLEAHKRWRLARNKPEGKFPGIRYVLLHTFAHIMIRELSLACGYDAASIRERIYSSTDGKEPMAGVLLYTSASDSDGTLGGLVDLGKQENFAPLLREGLHLARICSSDPLCSEYDPGNQDDGALDIRLAACHVCSYVAETSCEISNRYLDRALLIETMVGPGPAFFKLSDNSL
jgi:rubredoxin